MWWLGLMTVVEWCMQRCESRWCFVKCNCKINEICECCSVRKPLLKRHLQQKHFSKGSQFVKGDIQKNKYYFKTRRGKARSKKSILTIKSVAASHERKGFGQVFTRFRNRSLSSPHSSLQSYMGFFRQGNQSWDNKASLCSRRKVYQKSCRSFGMLYVLLIVIIRHSGSKLFVVLKI